LRAEDEPAHVAKRLQATEMSTSIPPDRWVRYFDQHGALDAGWLSSAISHWCFSERLHGQLVRFLPSGGRVLDVGCGPGNSVLWFAANGYSALGADREEQLVAIATERSRALGSTARFEVADAHDLADFHGQFDLAYSVGVLEHFDRAETVRLLQEQGKCARHVAIAIPTRLSRYTNEVSDERFYSMRELVRIVVDAGLTPVGRFGYGEVSATRLHRLISLLLPKAALRLAQDHGYAYTITVVGRNEQWPSRQT
jgi:SAM-dependent methyltransferase